MSNETTELREKLTERVIEWTASRYSGARHAEHTKWTTAGGSHAKYTEYDDGQTVMVIEVRNPTPEQAIAATLGSDDRYDAGFASGVQAVYQQLEGIEDYEELQCFIAEYWGEGEGNDER